MIKGQIHDFSAAVFFSSRLLIVHRLYECYLQIMRHMKIKNSKCMKNEARINLGYTATFDSVIIASN